MARTAVVLLLISAHFWREFLPVSARTEPCESQQVRVPIDPPEGVLAWADSGQDCTEYWYWIIQDNIPANLGIVLDIHDMELAEDDELKIFDNLQTHISYPVRGYDAQFRNTAPVLIYNNQAVIVARTGRESDRSRYSSFNMTLSTHPLRAMPEGLGLMSGDNDIGSRYRYNCSSRSVQIPDVLKCDRVAQCIGEEDEQDCDYKHTGCQEWLPYKDNCLKFIFSYVFIHKPDTLYDTIPLLAEKNCNENYRANLVQLPQMQDREFVGKVIQRSGFNTVAVGLRKVRVSNENYQRLYRFLWQWGGLGGPVAYDLQNIQREGILHDCSVLKVNPQLSLSPAGCVYNGLRPDGYVCSKPNPLFNNIPGPVKSVSLSAATPTLDKFPTKKCSDGSLVQAFHPCSLVSKNVSPENTVENASVENGVTKLSFENGDGRVSLARNNSSNIEKSSASVTFVAPTLQSAEVNNSLVQNNSTNTENSFEAPAKTNQTEDEMSLPVTLPAISSQMLPQFRCKCGQSIHYSLTCDGFSDCVDGSDETECQRPQLEIFFDSLFVCRKVQIIPQSKQCDGLLDCFDGSDEEDCSLCTGSQNSLYTQKLCPKIGCVPYVYTTRIKSCPVLNLVAEPRLQDLESGQVILDGYGMSWLEPLEQGDAPCPETHFQCPDGFCIPTFLLNNGVQDCINGEDERISEETFTCPGFYRCYSSSICIHPKYVCDGVPQCPNRDDELFCNLTCPSSCECEGYSYTCNETFNFREHLQVRYLDLSGVREPALHDLQYVELLHFLNLSSCQLRNVSMQGLGNLQVLDFSRNVLSSLQSLALEDLFNLRVLDLSHNPLLPRLDSAFSTLLNSASCVKLETLVLVNTSVSRVEKKAFSAAKNLATLNVKGNEIEDFDVSAFQGLEKLRLLRTDKSMLCCSLLEFSVCEAPVDNLSSCSDLLRSHLLKVFVWIVSLLAITGNVGMLVYRLLPKKSKSFHGYRVLLVHLCVSDCMMGIYLFMIGVADTRYRGGYAANDWRWRHSSACRVAGFTAVLYFEVSAFIIMLLTADRLTSLYLPYHAKTHITKLTATISSCLAWGVGVVLAAIPLLPSPSSWQLYSQTGICVPLPVTLNSFPGKDYVLGAVVVLNCIIFVLVGLGQILIMKAIHQTSAATNTTTTTIQIQQRRHNDIIISRRLFLIAFSEFGAWFFVCFLGLLAAGGVRIPEEWTVWTALFVLPLNSTLNPLLYALSVGVERRRVNRKGRRTKGLLLALRDKIDGWPAETVEELVRQILPGRDITLSNHGETTYHDKTPFENNTEMTRFSHRVNDSAAVLPGAGNNGVKCDNCLL